jgi:hypothetical protein
MLVRVESSSAAASTTSFNPAGMQDATNVHHQFHKGHENTLTFGSACCFLETGGGGLERYLLCFGLVNTVFFRVFTRIATTLRTPATGKLTLLKESFHDS